MRHHYNREKGFLRSWDAILVEALNTAWKMYFSYPDNAFEIEELDEDDVDGLNSQYGKSTSFIRATFV